MFRSFLGNVNFTDKEAVAGKHGFFKAAAVGAVALVLNDVVNLIAFLALDYARHNVDDELCIFKDSAFDNSGVNILNVLGDYHRYLADIENNLGNLIDIVFFRKFLDRMNDLSYYADFVHITS